MHTIFSTSGSFVFPQSEELGHLFYPDCRTPEPSLSCIITKKMHSAKYCMNPELARGKTCMPCLSPIRCFSCFICLFVCFYFFFYWSSELFRLRVTLDRSSNHRSSSLEGTLEYPRDESKATHEASS